MILFIPLSLGLGLLHNSLTTKKLVAIKALAASLIQPGDEYKTSNTGLVQDILLVLASQKISNLWIQEMSFEDKKCTITLKMRSMLVDNIYLYVSSIMDSDLFKKSGTDIIYSTITKKGYKSTGITDNKDSPEAKQAEPVPFILAYARKQQAERDANTDANTDAGPVKAVKKTSMPNKAGSEYNYEFTIKMSLCN